MDPVGEYGKGLNQVFENYKKRNSNIEILRIIAMFFVIFHHAISQGFSFYSSL